MMKSIRRVALLAAIAFVSLQSVNAQDIGFSQFYANPLYLNPAMAGSKIAPSLSLTYRCQWPALTSAYQTASISYDQYIDKLHGSIGAIAMYDRQGDHGALNTTYVGFMYAFRFNLTRDVFMNLALEAAVFNVHLKWDLNYLHFPDQIERGLKRGAGILRFASTIRAVLNTLSRTLLELLPNMVRLLTYRRVMAKTVTILGVTNSLKARG